MREPILALLVIVLFVSISFAVYSLYVLIVAWDKLLAIQYVLAGLYLTLAVLLTVGFFKLVGKTVEEGKQRKLEGKDEVGIIGRIGQILTLPAVIVTIAGLKYSYTPEHYLFLSGLVLLGFAFIMYYSDRAYRKIKKTS